MPAIKNLVFFGTPDFAVPTLDALEEAGRLPSLVVTRPARPAGRGQKKKPSPVAAWAEGRGIEILEPESVKDEAFLQEMTSRKPDIAVVVAFGLIFPPELLAIPKKGCVNVHASLLPKYRGASPVQATLIQGDKKTGITIMQMEEGMDSGAILLQEETEIKWYESHEELSERLAQLGGKVLVEALLRLEKRKIKIRKQREESATYCDKVSKEDGKVNWALTAVEIYNRLRAYTPWPGMTAYFRGRKVKLVWGVPMDWEEAPIGVSGTLLGLRQGRMAILCGSSTILGLEELQRPGKQPIRAADFMNGEQLRVGERFS